MKFEDVKIGMKVVPHSKTVAGYNDLQNSCEWKRSIKKGQQFLYVARMDMGRIILSETDDTIEGDYFLASDFEPYIEKKQKSKTEKQNIELIFNGTTTIALLKGDDGKYYKGIAKLHHEDIYDKLTGIRIAVSRALEVELPKEKTLSDFTNEELLKELEKRMKPKSEFLTYDEIRNLPNGTIIEYTDNYSGRDSIKYGYINQYKKWISMNDKIDWCNWYFDNLEKYEIQAKTYKEE